MHRLFACACALAIVSVGGCKDHYKDVAELQVANFTEFAAVLRDVKDQQTMDVAEDTLIARTAHFQAASRRAKSLADPQNPLSLSENDLSHCRHPTRSRLAQSESNFSGWKNPDGANVSLGRRRPRAFGRDGGPVVFSRSGAACL